MIVCTRYGDICGVEGIAIVSDYFESNGRPFASVFTRDANGEFQKQNVPIAEFYAVFADDATKQMFEKAYYEEKETGKEVADDT